MPWTVRKAGDKNFEIVKKDTGQVVGHSASLEKAQASIRARYANMPEKERKDGSQGRNY
jgi:hypothetical protein